MRLYIHIPFCRQACHYCDFHFSTSDRDQAGLVSALIDELRFWRENGWTAPWQSVYLGGGTPSLLAHEQLRRLFLEIRTEHGLSPGAEVTLEANPDDLKSRDMSAWRELGINRLSIGVQSFSDRDLQWMNRSHNANEALECLHSVREEGFERFSMDLIYGLPNGDAWQRNIDTVLAQRPPHISAYALTIEPKTVLGHRVKKGWDIPAPDERVEADYRELIHRLRDAGYRHYEISNFALPGHEALHNSAYWKGAIYLGIGPSAHSYDGNKRWWNVANNARYKKQLQGGVQWFEEETLSESERWNEMLMTALRTARGAKLSQLEECFPKQAEWPGEVAQQFIERGWLEEVDGHWRIPEIHWLLADHITSELMC